MKSFLLKLTVYLGVLAAFLAFVFAAYTKKFPPEKSFYMASRDKHLRLETLPSPRLIFIGGSSMAFGMDSGLVGQRLGFHPVNMGLNAGVGLEFMLQEEEPFVRPGDVVLLAPEYNTFEKFYHPEPEYVVRLIECRPSVLRALTAGQLKYLLDYGYLHHLGRVIRTVGGQSERILDGGNYQHTQRHSFNENGDVVSHHNVVGPKLGANRFKFTASPVAFTAIEHLNRFERKCQARGARVFYSHPPYEQRSHELNRATIAQLDGLLRARLQIPMLETVEDMVYPTEDFFDTEYHLNLKGKLKRSEKIAASLAQALGQVPVPPTKVP